MTDDERALTQLEELLDRRMDKAKAEGFSERTVEDVFRAARVATLVKPEE